MKDIRIHFAGGRVLVVLLFFALGAVAGLAAGKSYRIFHRGNLRAGGTILPGGEARFDSVRIGVPGHPLADGNPFILRLGDGRTLESADLSADVIATLATLTEHLPRDSEWGADAVEYSFEGMAFIFREGHCVCFRANWIRLPNRDHRPEIGSDRSAAFYKLPLTQSQLVVIFGEPDNIEDRSSL